MYPKNAATPPRIAIGAVVQISDGAVQTSGVSIKVKPEGGSASAGGGTTTYEEGIVAYVPTQAETNYTAFQVIAYKTGCIPVAVTVVTTDTATAGRVTVSGTKSTLDSLNDIAATAIVSGGAITTSGGAVSSVTTVTGNVTGSVASVTGNIGGNVVGSVASVTAGVTLANGAHGGAAASLTLQTLTVSNSAGNAVVFESTGGSGHGLCATGEGGGSGIVAIGGSTGYGLLAEGGSTTGHGAYFLAHGAGSYGALFYGGASGAAGAYFGSVSAGPGIEADITGDLTGNVSGSVGSVTGSVGSVTGNVGGNVVGSVASVTGAVGSVTGNVGGNVTGSVGSLGAQAKLDVNAEVDTALSDYDAPTNTEMVAAFTEIKGATWSSVTDTLEAIRDRGDAAWVTATGFSTLDAAGVRTAVGLASANLDTQLGDIPTVAEFEARTLPAANYFDPATDVVARVTLVDTTTTNTDMRGTDGANTTVPPSVSAISTQVAADLATAHGAGSWATATGFAVAGDAMTLTVAYDAAKTAAQAGDAMTLAANSITASVLATDCITSGKIATDAIGASELSTAAINAIQSGLATAANQATLLSNQTAIAEYIDTEVAAIKTVTDKLDTTLVLDGAVYDFTAAALAAAPSGGGGGGDATADNQTIIIAHLTDIKGATWDSSNSLEAIHDDLATVDGIADSILEDTGTTLPAAISAINIGAGSGARTVTVTVNDGSNPLQNASVRLTEGLNTYTASTNASGRATFNVDDATYTVAITKAGYTYAGTSLVITADATPTYSMTAVAITAAPSGYTTGYLYSYDENGDIEASISYRYRPVGPNAAATGESLSPDWNSVTSDANGLVEFPKMRLGVTYEYQRVGNERQVGKFKVPTDASSTTALPQII